MLTFAGGMLTALPVSPKSVSLLRVLTDDIAEKKM
jgi:hypothetical protein